jgi:hypothetical protein
VVSGLVRSSNDYPRGAIVTAANYSPPAESTMEMPSFTASDFHQDPSAVQEIAEDGSAEASRRGPLNGS